MKRIYLAYGSNMNLAQMAKRCPAAKLIGPATLKGWKLAFRGMDGGAVATIEPELGSEVPAVLWELEPEDEAALDRYEGYPYLYRKEMVEVVFEEKPVEAFVYIMNPGRGLGRPGDRYYTVIKQGYKAAGFDISRLDRAVWESVLEDCKKEALTRGFLFSCHF